MIFRPHVRPPTGQYYILNSEDLITLPHKSRVDQAGKAVYVRSWKQYNLGYRNYACQTRKVVQIMKSQKDQKGHK